MLLRSLAFAAAMTLTSAAHADTLRISEDELYDRIYASWLGQLSGNIYGLPHENIHVDEPGPDAFPYGYDFLTIPYYQWHFGSTKMTGVMEAYGGAFSDDDTDIEYIYLNVMESEGPEPRYADIRNGWVAHIDNWVWIANRQALALMHHGVGAPYTGRKEVNAEWFQIDPQLINEIWAVTAPGMIDYAAAKSDWGAKVSADSWGTEPTIAYGAMYAAAFFEPDTRKLIDIGKAALPKGSKFARTIDDMIALHQQYPNDWKVARAALARKYYLGEKPLSIWTANLNGACAILALLYGDGDFQKTMDMAAAIGFDADNQTATLGGLLGVAHGTKSIPDAFLYPVKGWTKPFNDRFLNRSRRDMPSTTITGLAKRTTALAEKNILARGGSVSMVDGKRVYTINSDATFTAPLEVSGLPPQTLEAGKPYALTLYGGGHAPRWHIAKGALPQGLKLSTDGKLSGTPTTRSETSAILIADENGQTAEGTFSFVVEGENLAPSATRVFGPETQNKVPLEKLRDGVSYGYEGVTVSSVASPTKVEAFGYEWKTPVSADTIVVSMGRMDEAAGWFDSLSADYKNDKGEWIPIASLAISPEPVLDNDKHLHPHFIPYTIRFDSVSASGIRVKGINGGEGDQRYISLSEIAVYGAR